MQVIIFSYESVVAVMSVAPNLDLSVLEVGQKDVPASLPFWIVDTSVLPVNILPEAWEIDELALGEPSGYGGTYEMGKGGEHRD